MPRRKKTEWEILRDAILKERQETGAYSPGVDDHLIKAYVAQAKLVADLQKEIDGNVITEGARQDEPVANPALTRLPSAISGLMQLGKQLGVGPYPRKLTTGIDPKRKPKVQNSAALLRPIQNRKKAK